jgi:3-phenylpropionate/cinnamic acid dioxygenase small subunit
MARTVNDHTHRQVVEFLMHEAELLDDRGFEEWLEQLTEDVVYQVPIRDTGKKNGDSEILRDGAWLSENWKSLDMRIRRLRIPGIVAEDPPSRTRHFVSNIRIVAGGNPDTVEVKSNLLVYRYRGESVHYDLFSGERRDIIRRVNGAWKLARRDLWLDQAVLTSQDISIIL